MRSLPLCAQEVMDTVDEHVYSDTRNEVGGVLVGRLTDGPTEIEAALPALKATGEATHVTFTHEVWEEILPRVDREYPDCRIVGWYHSHPGFGIFLSEHDKFIHANFFSDPRMLALVVDPLADQAGWFGWDAGAVQVMKTFPAARAVGRPAIPASAVSGSSRLRRRAGVVAAAGAVGIASFIVGAQRSTATRTDTVDSSTPAVVRVERDNQRLRDELARAQAADPVTAEPLPPAPLHPEQSEATSSNADSKWTFNYRVRRGDTVWKMAETFYGDGSRSGEIIEQNPGLNAMRLPVGVLVRVPCDPATKCLLSRI